MKNKKKNSIFLLLIIILVISIGYAILSRRLNIFGVSNISATNWDVHWDNIANEKGIKPVKNAYIKNSAKTIVEYEVLFDEPGQYYEFTVDAINEGTLDAELAEIIVKVNGNDISTLPSYISYSIKYVDDTTPTLGDVLVKKNGNIVDSKTYKIKVKYDETLITEALLDEMNVDGLDLVLSFNIKYKQKGIKLGNFSNDTWAEIAKAGPAAAKQETVVDGVCGDYSLGDTKTVKIDNVDYTVRIANCSTPPECKKAGFSQTACGFVLEFTDIVENRIMCPYTSWGGVLGDGNNGGWEYSDIRAYLNNGVYERNSVDYASNGFISKLPSSLQENLKETIVVSGKGYTQNGVSTVSDKIYLLASKELYGDTLNGEVDGAKTRQLDYYNSIGGSKNNYSVFIKKYNGTDSAWWHRSCINAPMYYNTSNFVGGWPPQFSDQENGISPAFRVG